MAATKRRKTSLTLNASLLDDARMLGINVSAVADVTLERAVAKALHQRWLEENAAAFAAQRDWHRRNGHPLAEVMLAPGRALQ